MTGPRVPGAARQRAVASANLEELISRFGMRENRIYPLWIPQAIAFVCYQISWLLFVGQACVVPPAQRGLRRPRQA